eukprot:m.32309 g.32309  ORF g.32309 m.32309 type:complete len:50 (+) comp6376_c0_seq1:807-956(+)
MLILFVFLIYGKKKKVSWVDVQPDMNLYASHDAFVEKVYAMRLAGFSSK